MSDPSAFTTKIPRLYDEYTAAMANAYRPELKLALDKLNAIIEAAEKARDRIIVMMVPVRPISIAEVLSESRCAEIRREMAEEDKRVPRTQR